MLLSMGVMGVGLWKWSTSLAPGPGAFLKTEPAQGITLAVPFKIKGYSIFTMASYQVDARVLGVRTYESDEGATLSPVDLALGWGPMSDQKILADVSVTQNDRFYYWTSSHKIAKRQEIIQKSANVHIIPASPEIKQFVTTVQPGELLSLKGRLVSVHGPGGWNWTSSLSRSDSGAGACELFYVEKASRIGVPKVAAKVETRPAASARPNTPQIARPAKPQAPTPAAVKTVILRNATTVKLRYGSLTIPSGAAVSVIEKRQGKLKAGYGGHEFWLDTSALPES